jgi:hypothetical protein
MHRRFSTRSLILSFAVATLVFAAAGQSVAQIRMVELDEDTQQVTLRNFNSVGNLDASTYWMCRAPGTYAAVSGLTIVGGGDLDLSPGEEVTIFYTAILAAGTGIGLYFNSSNFELPVNMADYMQYKGVAGFREVVAVSKGIWTTGTFASGDPGPYLYTGDGTQNGAAFWSSAPAPSVPTVSAWGVVVLCSLVIGAVVLRSRRGQLA